MDATYITLRYGFRCFFLVVKTAPGIGRVVGTIIPQYETEEFIQEELKEWNPGWSPQFFMTDKLKSAQELGAQLYVDVLCSTYIDNEFIFCCTYNPPGAVSDR